MNAGQNSYTDVDAYEDNEEYISPTVILTN